MIPASLVFIILTVTVAILFILDRFRNIKNKLAYTLVGILLGAFSLLWVYSLFVWIIS